MPKELLRLLEEGEGAIVQQLDEINRLNDARLSVTTASAALITMIDGQSARRQRLEQLWVLVNGHKISSAID